MQLTQIALYEFRNLVNQEIRFGERVTLVIGNNGQGKTNLLETIYLLSQAKSFRPAGPRDITCWKNEPRSEEEGSALPETKVVATIVGLDGSKEISYQLRGGTRQVFVNRKRVTRATEFYGQFLVIAFTPDDLQLVKGPPKIRRRFIDRVLAMVDPAFVESLVAYERSLKSRNAILRAYKAGKKAADRNQQQVELQLCVWNEALAKHGIVVADKRKQFIEAIGRNFSCYYEQLARHETGRDEAFDELANLKYKSELVLRGTTLTKRAFSQLLEEAQDNDLRNGITSIGVQRDDIDIRLDTGAGFKRARVIASQGQTRCLMLSMKLAAVDFLISSSGQRPVLLLDDIEAELDHERRSALFKLISSLNCQVILTATQLAQDMETLLPQTQILYIADGRVSAP